MFLKKIKLLIVDDQKSVRDVLKQLLADDQHIEVVGEAGDPLEARELIKQLSPDVLTLDVEMPKMDGITFLKNLMRLRPMPVVMLSTLTSRGASVTLDALEIGAVDFIAKPKIQDIVNNQSMFRLSLVNKIKAAAQVGQDHYLNHHSSLPQEEKQLDVPIGKLKPMHIVAIGSSTGGTEAIKKIVTKLPIQSPPIVIVQHIPESFSERFAARLNAICAVEVHEAKNGQPILPGNVYIAPGNRHFAVKMQAGRYFCKIFDGELVNRHKPSVSVLFNSLADTTIALNVHAIMLTGMGKDGADAMKAIHTNGAITTAQDKSSSLVWGMPGSAVALGGVDEQLPINEMAKHILKLAYN